MGRSLGSSSLLRPAAHAGFEPRCRQSEVELMSAFSREFVVRLQCAFLVWSTRTSATASTKPSTSACPWWSGRRCTTAITIVVYGKGPNFSDVVKGVRVQSGVEVRAR